MRWITVLASLALTVALTAGCKQQCFLHDCDYETYVRGLDLPERTLECDPNAGQPNPKNVIPTPSTVDRPEQPIRYMTLAEAIALALEHGDVNGFSQGRTINDNIISFSGQLVAGSDAIRVLALDPAITGVDIDTSLSKFDARWTTSMIWTSTDTPLGSAAANVQAGAFAGVRQRSVTDEDASFTTGVVKPLPTGGTAGITFNTSYDLTNSPAATINPSYRPTLTFSFEQPLLQGYGVEINQLLQAHPGPSGLLNGNQTPFLGGQRAVEGILITRIRYDQARAEFERNVQLLAYNVEQAYWNLYSAYWNLYSNEQAMRQAFEVWKIFAARYAAGQKGLADFAQTRGQYEMFRQQRITALGQVLEAERVLRRHLGLPVSDCVRLVPCDTPTLAPYHPDWCEGYNEMLCLRPDLVEVREDLKFRQLDVIRQKNFLLPDLRFVSDYAITAIGNRLDGPGPNNAFQQLASDHFRNWELGLQLSVPLGYREAHSNVRLARLNLARTYSVLRDAEYRAGADLTFRYRQIFEQYATAEALRAEREGYEEQLRAQFQLVLYGRQSPDVLLEAMRFWSAALSLEFAAIANYNNALAGWEWSKGTILHHDNICIAEGPLPECAQVRAVVHEQERSKALVLLERALPVPQKALCGDKGGPLVPDLPANSAPALPALLDNAGSVKDLPEHLPPPRKVTPGAPESTGPEGIPPPMPGAPPAGMTPPAPGTDLSAPPPSMPSFAPQAPPATSAVPAAPTMLPPTAVTGSPQPTSRP